MSKMKIKIDKLGKVTTEVTGAPGGACQRVSQPYLDAFAGQVTADEPTVEASLPEIQETETENESL